MPIRSSKIDPVAREARVIEFLDKVPRELSPILVGGYAVAAYGPPRYSADVDLVLPRVARPDIEAWLRANQIGFRQTLKIEGREGPLTKLLIFRGLISGDVYLGGIRSRPSGADVEYDWIAKSPNSERLSLTTGSTSLTFPTARIEAVWLLKLLAGRPQDITDLFAISDWPVQESQVREKLEELLDVATKAHLKTVRERLDRDKEYHDALSRRGLGSPEISSNRLRWDRFKVRATNMIPG